MSPKRKKEWFDDQAFWRDFYPFMFSEERFSETPEQMQKVLTLTGVSGGAVLDLCCGPGRCSIALAREGFRVTGVDKTPYLLDKARKRAEKAGVVVEWIQEDMRDFARENAFDLALSMFTSFGYFEDKEDDMRVLANLLKSLKPGGVFLMDVMGKEILAKIRQPAFCDVLDNGGKILQINEIVEDWTRVRNQWILIQNEKAKTHTFEHTIYSGQELKDRLQNAGFTGVKLFGNFNGDPYGPEAQRLVAMGRKPEKEQPTQKKGTKG